MNHCPVFHVLSVPVLRRYREYSSRYSTLVLPIVNLTPLSLILAHKVSKIISGLNKLVICRDNDAASWSYYLGRHIANGGGAVNSWLVGRKKKMVFWPRCKYNRFITFKFGAGRHIKLTKFAGLPAQPTCSDYCDTAQEALTPVTTRTAEWKDKYHRAGIADWQIQSTSELDKSDGCKRVYWLVVVWLLEGWLVGWLRL